MTIFNETSLQAKKQFEDILKEADQDGNGEISLSEFKELMLKFV